MSRIFSLDFNRLTNPDRPVSLSKNKAAYSLDQNPSALYVLLQSPRAKRAKRVLNDTSNEPLLIFDDARAVSQTPHTHG